MKYKTGCFVGKFLPPHVGHLSVIDRALSECENVVVVLAESPNRSQKLCEKAGFPYFSPQKRLEWMKKHYKNNKNMKFIFFDETGIEPSDLKTWSEKFKRQIKNIDAKYADESYRNLNETYFPECKFVPIDRDKIAIHGTDIRENRENIKFMIPEGKKEVEDYFKKTIDKKGE